MRDSFSEILNYLISKGYKKSDIVDRRFMRHFVAFYYFCKRDDAKKKKASEKGA